MVDFYKWSEKILGKKGVVFCVLLLCLQNLRAQVPVIESFSPLSGSTGATITISGANFNPIASGNIVFFAGVKAEVSATSSTSLTVKVPRGATCQPITVTSNGLSAYSMIPFRLTFAGGGAITQTSFLKGMDFTTTGYASVATDFDSDGKADIAMVDIGGKSVSLFKNNSNPGSLSIAAKLSIAAGSDPYGLASGDLDGDGKPDIAEVNYSTNTVSILKNTSAGGIISFASKINFTTGINPYSVSIADFDNDGRPDIVTANEYAAPATVSILRNTSFPGSISFAEKTDHLTGKQPRNIAVGDIDGDGKTDIVTANQESGSVSILLNTSSGPANISFSPKSDVSPTTGAAPESVAIGDIDGDGKMDIAVANNNNMGTVSVFLNLGTPGNISFGPPVDLLTGTGSYPYNIVLCDLDGDGKSEVAVNNQVLKTVSVFRNKSVPGNLSFEAKVDFATNGYHLSVGDIDNDGKPDLVSNNSILRNVVDGPNVVSFSPVAGGDGETITISGTNFTGTTAVTFGGTKAASLTVVSDIVIKAVIGKGASGPVSVSTVKGLGSLSGFSYTGTAVQPPVISSFAPLSGPVGSTVIIKGTNFNGAIPADNIVYFGAARATVTNATASTLTVKVPFGTTYQPITVTTSNHTGYSDRPFIATFEGENKFTPESFDQKIDFATGGDTYRSNICDYNGDGKPDLAIVNAGSNTVTILRNTGESGSITFAEKIDSSTGKQPVNICSGDIDGDSKPDIIIANTGSNNISVLRNTSSGNKISFEFRKEFIVGTNPRGIFIMDLDQDGKPDIAIANYGSAMVSVLKNTSSGVGVISFADKVDYNSGVKPSFIAAGDLNGDGQPDIVSTNYSSNTVTVFRNDNLKGVISFSGRIDLATGVQPGCVALGDLDGDGRAELSVTNNSSGSISIFRNTGVNGSISFDQKVDMVAGAGCFAASIGDLNGDGKPDIAVVSVYESAVSIYRNNCIPGKIAFDPPVDYTTGFYPRCSSIGDLDGDGRPDIVAVNNNDNNISVFRNLPPPNLCAGRSQTLKSDLSGSSYQWQRDDGKGFIDIDEINANYIGVRTSTLQIKALPSSWYGFQFRCMVDGVSGKNFRINFETTWSGIKNDDWEEPLNWSCGVVPDANTDVIINSGTPVLNTVKSCRSLKVSQGATLTLNNGANLNISH